SHNSIAAPVRRVTPPRLSPAEDGRTNAPAVRASSDILVLSPRIAPPPRFEAGSTASTAIRRPSAMPARPKRSMKVDLPAPGGPEMPMRTAQPVCGSSASTSRSASARWSGRVDSTRVTARASARRSPRRNAAVSFSVLTLPSTRGGGGFALSRLLLSGPHRGVDAAAQEQFPMATTLHDMAAVEHENLVGVDDRRQPVRDDERRTVGGELGEARLDP